MLEGPAGWVNFLSAPGGRADMMSASGEGTLFSMGGESGA